MTSSRPYLLRALYEWIVDNNCTPHLLVNAEYPHVQVPRQHVKDGQIVLNVSPTAVVSLQMSNDEVTFGARFGGVAMQVRAPVGAVLGIYARENGQGMLFEPESEPPPEPPAPEESGSGSGTGGRPALRVVK